MAYDGLKILPGPSSCLVWEALIWWVSLDRKERDLGTKPWGYFSIYYLGDKEKPSVKTDQEQLVKLGENRKRMVLPKSQEESVPNASDRLWKGNN